MRTRTSDFALIGAAGHGTVVRTETLRFESADHALRRYANLRRSLEGGSGFDPASIRKRCKALVCKHCERGGAKLKDKHQCGHPRARWIEWDEWELKPIGGTRKYGAPQESALLEMATLGRHLDRVHLWPRRALWLYVVEGLSHQAIADLGRERWRRSRISWHRRRVADLVREGRREYTRALGPLIHAA